MSKNIERDPKTGRFLSGHKPSYEGYLPKGQAAFNALYRSYIKNARQHTFELTKEDFSFLTKMNCHYCGVEPKQFYPTLEASDAYIYNGIDRIDNIGGYILSNVVPCCRVCNYAKKNLAKKEFLAWVDRIYNHQHRVS